MAPKISLQYSDNNGYTWKTLTVGASGVTPTTVTLANVGDYIYVKATTTNDATSVGGYGGNNRFIMTGKISASGNVMSLLDGSRFGVINTIQSGYCFNGLFEGCSALTTAPDLPATTLADFCYYNMFEGCSAMTTAPDLPATTLATGCYNGMYLNCTSLNNIKIAYTDVFKNYYSGDWTRGVASSGTLYYSGTDTQRGTYAIPENWTVLPYESRGA